MVYRSQISRQNILAREWSRNWGSWPNYIANLHRKEPIPHLHSELRVRVRVRCLCAFYLLWRLRVPRAEQAGATEREGAVGREALGPAQLQVEERGGQWEVGVPALHLQTLTSQAEQHIQIDIAMKSRIHQHVCSVSYLPSYSNINDPITKTHDWQKLQVAVKRFQSVMSLSITSTFKKTNSTRDLYQLRVFVCDSNGFSVMTRWQLTFLDGRKTGLFTQSV